MSTRIIGVCHGWDPPSPLTLLSSIVDCKSGEIREQIVHDCFQSRERDLPEGSRLHRDGSIAKHLIYCLKLPK